MHLTSKISEAGLDEMPLAITITMTIREWREIMRDRGGAAPAQLQTRISEVLGHISRMAQMTIAFPKHDQ